MAVQGAAAPALLAAGQQPVPAYVAKLFDVVGKIGEGTYGVVYLARSREPRPSLLAVKTFKPGKACPGARTEPSTQLPLDTCRHKLLRASPSEAVQLGKACFRARSGIL